jgi:hypothetical protein
MRIRISGRTPRRNDFGVINFHLVGSGMDSDDAGSLMEMDACHRLFVFLISVEGSNRNEFLRLLQSLAGLETILI